MTDDDKKALIEFLSGVGVVIGLVGAVLVLFFVLSGGGEVLENEKFKVVDTYKGCDVVRYTPGNTSTYKYFLHCNNTRPVYEK
jgi:hypothetical protein